MDFVRLVSTLRPGPRRQQGRRDRRNGDFWCAEEPSLGSARPAAEGPLALPVPPPAGDHAGMFESTWILWIAVACLALVALAVLAGRYTAGLFLDATRPPLAVDPRPSDQGK